MIHFRPLLYLMKLSWARQSNPRDNEMNMWNKLPSWTRANLNSRPSVWQPWSLPCNQDERPSFQGDIFHNWVRANDILSLLVVQWHSCTDKLKTNTSLPMKTKTTIAKIVLPTMISWFTLSTCRTFNQNQMPHYVRYRNSSKIFTIIWLL